jgi:hypothetical protein
MKSIIALLCFILCSHYLFAQKRPSLIPYRKGELWGYCDTTKKIIIPIIYRAAFPFIDGRALVETTDFKMKLIDSSGATIKIFPYHMGKYVYDLNMVQVHNNNYSNTGILHLNGKLILPIKYKSIEVFGKDSFEVVQNSKRGIINSKADTLKAFDPTQEDMFGFAKLSFLPNSNCENPCVFGNFSEQMAVAAQMDLFGYMDSTLRVVIPCKYQMAETFAYGLGRVSFTDPHKMASPINYENGIAVYSASDLMMHEGYVDRLGNEYWNHFFCSE